MKRLRRTIIVFAAITLFVAIAGAIYTYFGRGVTSDFMGHAYFYPLVAGVLFNLLLMLVQPRLPFVGTVGYRLYSNVFNAGIGALTSCSFIAGVLEIAGVDSNLMQYFWIIGWVVLAAGFCILCILIYQVLQAMARSRKRPPARRYR